MIQYIIIRLLSFILWVFIAVIAIPIGVFMLLNKWFPDFTQELGFWFWCVFGSVTILLYRILRKPLLWIIGIFQVMGGAGE